jgi:hypothetical protein
MCAQRLAGINPSADAAATEVARKPEVEPYNARLLAIETMDPRSIAAEMKLFPRGSDSLGERMASQVEQDRRLEAGLFMGFAVDQQRRSHGQTSLSGFANAC